VERVFHPTASQPRSNFKRIWVGEGHGVPFLTGRQLFAFRPEAEKHLAASMPKLRELRVSPGSILLSRSGTTGFPVFVGRWLSQYAVTDDAIRIVPREHAAVPTGYIYCVLLSDVAHAVVASQEYGSTVSHLEAKHVERLPIPMIPEAARQRCDKLARRATALRDEANELLDGAEQELYELLGLRPFTEDDIAYLDRDSGIRAFSTASSTLEARLDATKHVPIVASVRQKLAKGKYPLAPLGRHCSIWIPGRFKREFVGASSDGVPYLLPAQLPLARPYGVKTVSVRQATKRNEYCLKPKTLLITTDGTVGRVHPVTPRMIGWFASNNIARVRSTTVDVNFLAVYMSTRYGIHQLRSEIYGGVVDHINEAHIAGVLCPEVPKRDQLGIARVVHLAYSKKDEAIALEDEALNVVKAELSRLNR